MCVWLSAFWMTWHSQQLLSSITSLWWQNKYRINFIVEPLSLEHLDILKYKVAEAAETFIFSYTHICCVIYILSVFLQFYFGLYSFLFLALFREDISMCADK